MAEERLDPERILTQLAQTPAVRPSRARAFMQQHQTAIRRALAVGYRAGALYRALAALGHPPPMSLRQFRRYLATWRPDPSAVTTVLSRSSASPVRIPTPPRQDSDPQSPARPPATFRWDPLSDDSEIH